jgi:4,5-DOPA dioxygenase extradiol
MTTARTPAIFLAHGSPYLLDDELWKTELRAWSYALPRPAAILVLSAHWRERPITVGATTTVPLVYDFYGFPERYYATTYPAPGAPELARRVAALLSADGPSRRMRIAARSGAVRAARGHVSRR